MSSAWTDQGRPGERFGAHFASIFGARLDVVTAREYPPSYGWAAIAPEWDPAQDMRNVLEDAAREVFGDRPPDGMQLIVARAVPPRYFSMRVRARS